MAAKNKVMIGLASLAAVTTIVGVASTSVFAETGASGTTLVDRIATKFNLNKDEVQAVFNEDRAAKEAERINLISEELQAAVDDGDITADQKALIETKLKELQATRASERTALQEWADANSIDLKYVMMGGRGLGGNDNDRLAAAVEDGSLTAEQKSFIEAKQSELQAAREAQKEALEKWATDNNIDTQYLRGMGMGRHGGPGRGGDL